MSAEGGALGVLGARDASTDLPDLGGFAACERGAEKPPASKALSSGVGLVFVRDTSLA
jgi:hypothetical protein